MTVFFLVAKEHQKGDVSLNGRSHFSDNVKAAVTNHSGNLNYKTLIEIQPYHWYKAYEVKL